MLINTQSYRADIQGLRAIAIILLQYQANFTYLFFYLCNLLIAGGTLNLKLRISNE